MAIGTMYKSKSRRGRPRKTRKLATVQQVKSLIARNVDKEDFNKVVAGGTVLTAGAIFSLLDTADITDDAKLDKLSLRFSLTNITNANQLVRVIIFQYKQSSAISAPTVASVLNTASPLSGYVENYSQTAHILSDKSYTMNLFNKSMITVSHPYFKRMLGFKNNATSGLDGNNVFMIVIGTVNTNTTLSSIYLDCKYHQVD